MKKSFKALVVIAAAAATLASCQKQEDVVNIPSEKTITLNFNALPLETKTVFGEKDGTAYPTLWTESSTIQASLNFASAVSGTLTPSSDNKSATFSATFKVPETTPEEYVIYALSPKILGVSSNNSTISFEIPTSQTPTEASVDEEAQFVFGSTTLTALPDPDDPDAETLKSTVSPIDISFTHLTAYGKMTIKDEAVIAAGIKSVSLIASKPIAGRWNYAPADGTYSENSTASTITLTTSSAEGIWFAIAPTDLSEGTLKVTVSTDDGTYEKTIDFTGTGKGNFKAGTVAAFGVKGFTKVEDVVYDLVTDITNLTPNSVVIIAAAASNMAISTTQNTNNRAGTGVTKNEDATQILNPLDAVETFIVETGANAGTYAFHAQTNEGYIYASGGTSGNHLRTKDELDLTSSWTVSIAEDGVATIKCANTEVTRNWLRFNSSSSLFACYEKNQADVAIYKLQGSGDAPVELGTITLAQTEFTFPAEGGDSDEIDITFDPESKSCDLDVTTDASWITSTNNPINDGDGLLFSVAANTGAARTGTITLSGTTVRSATVTVNQEAAAVTEKTLPYEDLTSSIETFSIDNVSLGSLSEIWSWNSSYNYAKASGYNAGDATESWLVSPVINMEDAAGLIVMTFSHATNYFSGTASTATAVLVKKAEASEWTALNVNYPSSDSWAFESSGEINLSDYAGSKIQIAFKYTSTTGTAGTWEVKNLKIEEVDALTPTFSNVPSGKVEIEIDETYQSEVSVNSNGALSFESSDESVATVSSTGLVTGIGEGTATITVTAAANGDYAKSSTSFVVSVTDPNSGEVTATETIDLTAQGYSNAQAVTNVSGSVVSLVFAQGTNTNNAPKYYTNGTAVRTYTGNTLTISASDKIIKNIVFTCDGSSYTVSTPDSGTYSDCEWNGKAASVVFTTGTAQFRVQKVAVTYVVSE